MNSLLDGAYIGLKKTMKGVSIVSVNTVCVCVYVGGTDWALWKASSDSVFRVQNVD